jgi:uncharacterized protein YdcH (DUF465 family)
MNEVETRINELQENAANALNVLLTALKQELFEFKDPLTFFDIAFQYKEDDNGFTFLPKEL